MESLIEFLEMLQREATKKMQPNDMAAVLIERRELDFLNRYLEKKPREDGFSLLAGYALAGLLANPLYESKDNREVARRAILLAKELNEQLKTTS